MYSSNLVGVAALFVAFASAAPFVTRDTADTPDLNYPSGCMTSYKNISFGWLPDYTGVNMATINNDSGKKACMYGYYMQFGTSYDDSQLTESSRMSDIVNSGAVFVPAIMPTGLTFSQIDSNMAQNIANTVSKFTDQGVQVFLRFAHEMNYYSMSNVGTYPGGTPAEFITAWQNVHAAVASNPKCLMFWSPNSQDVADIQNWWPGADYVDIVGMDVYPAAGSSFSSVFSDFYNAFPNTYNKHFILGETGSGSYATQDKEDWLAQVASSDFSAFPKYQGAAWFEYLKDGDDFRVLVDQSSDTITETLSNFA